MVWDYKVALVSQEDFYAMSKPKSRLMGFFGFYSLTCLWMYMTKQINPELYFRKLIISPVLVPTLAISPFIAIYAYQKAQYKVNNEVMQRTIGHLSDRELLEFEIKLNPARKVIYDNII